MNSRFSLHTALLTACLTGMVSMLFPLAGADTEPPPEPPAAEPPVKVESPDELPTGDDVKPSVYKSLPKPFQSKPIGETKPLTVWYDAKARRVYIEGRFCLAEGGIEFLAVAVGGKVHESLLELACRPQDVLYAMLVCAFECNNNLQGEGEEIVPAGDPMFIYVEYQKDGKTIRRRIEDFAFNRYTEKNMKNISFAFTGSSYTKIPDTGKSVFLADMEKDLITCFRTAWSVFNTPLVQGNNDAVYQVNKNVVPPRDTACVVIITRGKPIDKNELDDSGGKEIKKDGNEGKGAQMEAQENPPPKTVEFTPAPIAP